jgi:hypothetical protein
MNLNNGGIIDMDISLSRKFVADEKIDNDDEFNIGTKSLTEATINERQETFLSDGAHIKEDDKGLLEESFDLHSSKVEEKHLCSSLF